MLRETTSWEVEGRVGGTTGIAIANPSGGSGPLQGAGVKVIRPLGLESASPGPPQCSWKNSLWKLGRAHPSSSGMEVENELVPQIPEVSSRQPPGVLCTAPAMARGSFQSHD